ncbi:hypothetical protein [Herbiconiux daphne]|uniref:Uncharacterized protein n=1 Tax=Herbiconiux daphne TaxID=2970914 RepID=A0ABT2H0V8_9MICO|nr:hypothetical protein [Herbiconiux daphne]MCS5733550.1 hypothetical protein [Herbiconiux daphne]
MNISEYSFPWLNEAREQQVTEQLERRRVAQERAEQQVPTGTVPVRVGRWLRRMSVAGGTM